MTAAINRTLSALELLSRHPQGVAVRPVASGLGLAPSAAHRLLNDLRQAGYVQQDPMTGTYRLTIRLAALGLSWLGRTGITDVCQPVLDDLARASGELVRLSVSDGEKLVWVAFAQGAEASLAYSASGRAWAATLDPDVALQLIAKQGLLPPDGAADNVSLTMNQATQLLIRTRSAGHAQAVDCFLAGMAAIAVPPARPRSCTRLSVDRRPSGPPDLKAQGGIAARAASSSGRDCRYASCLGFLPRAAMTQDCDVLVIGSGAAGLAAAVTAAHCGLRVIVAEKAAVLGGTTAWSGGWIWAPGNLVCAEAGTKDSVAAAETYLRAVLANHFDAPRVQAFLTYAPRMVAFFQSQTALAFEPGSHIPDTYGDLPGAGTGGRSVIAAPYDGRALGPLIRLLRRPLRETTFWGLTIQAGPDLRAFMTMTRHPRAFAHVARRMTRHLWDLARRGRAMQLRNGQALVARLIRSAADLGVTFQTGSPAVRLLTEGDHVIGAVLSKDGVEFPIRANRGVVLTSGGFPYTLPHRSLAVHTATGDGARMAEAIGARQGQSASPGAWCPVSVVRWPDGREAPFPHIIERGKPGLIAVLPNGQRFCNEGLGYHDFVKALLAVTPPGQLPEAWLIATRAFQRRYGLGISRPFPVPMQPRLRSGYLKSGPTPEALAATCGIDPAGLRATLDDWNLHAAHGFDPAFHRGTTPYMRLQGDASHQPNPCVAPINRPPYLAVKVIPGSFGTFAGLETDAAARVLHDGTPIPGLYAAGTDMASVIGGFYPAGGINLGPALTFGYIASLHTAGRLEPAA